MLTALKRLERTAHPMPPSDKLSELRARLRASHGHLVALEARAGTAKAAEELRTEPASYHLIYDAAEPFSDRQNEITDNLERDHQGNTVRQLRKLYFSVRDAELRKALIA